MSIHGDSATACRILFITGQMGGGGLEQQLCYLLQGIDRQLYQPGLVVWNYNESDVNLKKVRDLEVPVWGYPTSASSYWKLVELTKLARKLSPEVVHSYCFFTNFAAFWSARSAGAIAVGSVRGENDLTLSSRRPILGRLSSSLPVQQISNSHAAAKKALSSERWFKPKHMTVVPNSLDLQRFKEDPIPLVAPLHILGIGSLIPLKRWDRLLKVGQQLKERGLPCVIEIAGDGPMRQELESLAATLGIAETTHFLGYRSDIPELIARARMVVHTADNEGSPNAVMEALASGRPIIATDVGDVAQLIENGKTGFVVPCEDSEALLASVTEVLTNDLLAKRLSRAAREYAQREFQLPRLAERTLEMYRSVGWRT